MLFFICICEEFGILFYFFVGFSDVGFSDVEERFFINVYSKVILKLL